MRVMDVVGEALKRENLKVLTGFPYNQVIDSCARLGTRPLIARSERVAINMADGFSRMSAGVAYGVCAVQYGPGAEASFGAIAQAFADSVPILLVPGGYDSHWAGVDPNFRAEQMRSITKAVLSVNYPERAALMVQRAFGLLRAGKPGPVILEIPDDIMALDTPFDPDRYRPVHMAPAQASPGDIERLVARIRSAKAPVLMAGRGVLQSGAWAELKLVAERLHLPVMTTLSGKSAFPEDHPLALGTGGLSRTGMVDHFLAGADLVVGVGTTFTRSHYIAAVPNGPAIVQITNDPIDVSNSYFLDEVIVGDIRAVVGQLAEAAFDGAPKFAPQKSAVAQEIARIKKDFLARWADRLGSDAEPISPYRVIAELMRTVDRRRTCLTHDSGNPRDQIVPFFEALTPLGYIGWGKSTPLGSGLGLIMGAKLAKPDWTCINIMGDAAIGMVGMDLETAVRCNIPTLTIVLNNGLMGGYTFWQPVATEKFRIQYLGGDYVAIARALGLQAERVERVAELRPAFERAINATKNGTPALIEVQTREEAILAVPQKHA